MGILAHLTIRNLPDAKSRFCKDEPFFRMIGLGSISAVSYCHLRFNPFSTAASPPSTMTIRPRLSSNTLVKWGAIALLELIVALILIAMAPIFLNSSQPLVGFLIWVGVVLMLSGSGVYAIARIRDGYHARKLFITAFPDYSYLGVQDFLEISSHQVRQTIDTIQTAQADPDFSSLQISPLDVLQGARKPWRFRKPS